MHIRRLDPAGDTADLDAILPAFQAANLEARPGFPAHGAARLLLESVGPGYKRRSTVFGAFESEADTEAQAVAFLGMELDKNLDLAWADFCVPAEARARGVDGALGAVVALVLTARADGSLARLKACRRDVCHWVFYDRSRNHSSHWCAMAVCGNRTKTRAYRRRRAA